METGKKLSYRLMLWIFVWLALLGVGIACLVLWETGAFSGGLYSLEGLDKPSLESIDAALTHTTQRFLQIFGASLVVTWLLLWVSLRAALKKLFVPFSGAGRASAAKPVQPVAEGAKTGEGENRRRELQLLSLLQREGRLVDFLKEDLQAYDDAQIGAAVRGIQENCQKALNRYVDPQAIIDQEEGLEVAVPQGFDPSKIKLTGNVSGNPPFKGILQHRGWRVGHRDLPILSGTLDPDVISPAEVEIPG
ncbi:MAG: DUF2760 domain-containing protein [Deltaproteobacteria bacterium]|nr:DUF2760 domain-containing protein [Deltaproteobacteria bacterium]